MNYSITSSDIDIIEKAYYGFYDKFYNIASHGAALEIIVDGQVHSNPSWDKVQKLHKDYNKLKITYRLEK